MTKIIDGLSELAQDYDAFALGIYGVIDDGQSIKASAVQCLEALSDLSKTVAIFANTPWRHQQTMHWLAQRNIPPSLYQHILTAGEETWSHLKERHDPFHASLGYRCYFIGSPQTTAMLEDLSISRVSNIEQADFILAMELGEWDEDVQSYKKLFTQAIAANLPMICGCPEKYIFLNGKAVEQAGALAQFFEKLGGVVYFHGKPMREFYMALKKRVAPIPLEKTLLIGDNPPIDLKGAQGHKIPNLLVYSPRTAVELGLSEEKGFPKEKILSKLRAMNLAPTHLMEKFVW